VDSNQWTIPEQSARRGKADKKLAGRGTIDPRPNAAPGKKVALERLEARGARRV
jgi:hypothetical protein